MTLAIVNWAERLLAAGTPPLESSRKGHDRRRPMTITVERLPDYLWRELGFQQPRHPENDRWFRS